MNQRESVRRKSNAGVKKKDFTLYNLRGGLLAWVHDGGEVVDEKGKTKRIHVYGRKWNLAPRSYEAVW